MPYSERRTIRPFLYIKAKALPVMEKKNVNTLEPKWSASEYAMKHARKTLRWIQFLFTPGSVPRSHVFQFLNFWSSQCSKETFLKPCHPGMMWEGNKITNNKKPSYSIAWEQSTKAIGIPAINSQRKKSQINSK